ncbi:unnamed protein product [Ascophyllum nodosum]
MALLYEKLRAIKATQEAHARRFNDPAFHFVPRRKLMQLQSGCIKTICEVLDKNNRTDAGQQLDVSVVEEGLSVLMLHVYRSRERYRELLDGRGCVRVIVTGIRESSTNYFMQEKGIKLIDDACLTLERCAEPFVTAGALEAIVDAMGRFADNPNLQACGCDAISSIVSALPDNGDYLGDVVFAVGAQVAAARALQCHTRSEDVLVAGSQALETITLRCGALGRTLVQDALSTHPVPCGNTINCLASASERSSTATGRHASYKSQAGTVLSSPGDEFKGLESSSGDSGGCLGPTGAIGFALRLADAYGRDDSRTIVRRTGAARVGACAFNLVRALLSDRWGGELPDTTASEGGVPPDVVSEFCAEKGLDIIFSVIEHHIHDPMLLIAAWQAMHAVVCLAWSEIRRRRRQQYSTESEGTTDEPGDGAQEAEAGRPNSQEKTSALLLRLQGLLIENLELTVRVAASVMDQHVAVAPLQWICLACLADLQAVDSVVSDMFFANSGYKVLHRCIQMNSRHTAVVEQACRLVAAMSVVSYTSRSRFMMEKFQDVIQEMMYLHERHPGVQVLGGRALNALWGRDETEAKQKAAAERRLKEERSGDLA